MKLNTTLKKSSFSSQVLIYDYPYEWDIMYIDQSQPEFETRKLWTKIV